MEKIVRKNHFADYFFQRSNTLELFENYLSSIRSLQVCSTCSYTLEPYRLIVFLVYTNTFTKSLLVYTNLG